jgi:hypothetical protein
MASYQVQTTTFVKTQTTTKKLFKFIRKITHVDDMMIHNLVEYIIQTRLGL